MCHRIKNITFVFFVNIIQVSFLRSSNLKRNYWSADTTTRMESRWITSYFSYSGYKNNMNVQL